MGDVKSIRFVKVDGGNGQGQTNQQNNYQQNYQQDYNGNNNRDYRQATIITKEMANTTRMETIMAIDCAHWLKIYFFKQSFAAFRT
jgi:hypothetical protein